MSKTVSSLKCDNLESCAAGACQRLQTRSGVILVTFVVCDGHRERRVDRDLRGARPTPPEAETRTNRSGLLAYAAARTACRRATTARRARSADWSPWRGGCGSGTVRSGSCSCSSSSRRRTRRMATRALLEGPMNIGACPIPSHFPPSRLSTTC